MNINIEIDLTPDEMRRFMGLPDVQGWQQQMIESYTENLTSSQEQQQEFLRNLIAGSMGPWQDFFAAFSGTTTSAAKKSGADDEND